MFAALLPWLAAALIVFSLLILSIATYGMLRMPDPYTQLHAASKAAFLGIVPLLVAVSTTGDAAIIARSILIAVFLLLTTPVSTHVIGRAAFRAGERLETPGAVDETHLLPHATPPSAVDQQMHSARVSS